MMDRVTIPELCLKFAEKSWADTFQLVRRCMVRQTSLNKNENASTQMVYLNHFSCTVRVFFFFFFKSRLTQKRLLILFLI